MSGTFQGRVAFASCLVTPGSVTFQCQSGDFDSVVYNGAGEFQIVLAPGSQVDPAECALQLTIRSTGLGLLGYVLDTQTDSTIDIEVVDTTGGFNILTDPFGFDLTILVKPLV